MTIERVLQLAKDEDLVAIQREIRSKVIPKSGAAHSFCRRINRLIDQGKVEINPFSYRHMYLPSLVKFVSAEISARYIVLYDGKYLNNHTKDKYEQITLQEVFGDAYQANSKGII